MFNFQHSVKHKFICPLCYFTCTDTKVMKETSLHFERLID